jgi:hypothetical protein
MTPQPNPNDPSTWPSADAVPTDVFLGTYTHDCAPGLTDEQKLWPLADAVPTDVFLGTFIQKCTPGLTGEQMPEPPDQPAAPSRP